jgi:hypothetical protein
MSLVKVFEDVDMRFGITGLGEFLTKHKVKASDANDMFMFINKKKCALKIIWGDRFLLNLRKPSNEGKITIDEIKAIPRYFAKQLMDFKVERRAAEILGATFKVKAVS